MKQFLSEMWVLIRKLEGKGWEDHVKVAPVFKVSRAEKAGTEPSICKAHIGERLGNGRFPRPRKAIQPEDALISLVCRPMLKLEEDLLPRSLQALLPLPRTVSSLVGVMHAVQKNPLRVSLFKGYYVVRT